MYRKAIPILSRLFFLLLTTGCHSDSSDLTLLYQQYRFDKNIIDKLPVYDSLAAAIVEKAAFFQQHIDEKESYRSYKYMPGSADGDAARKLPEEIASKIDTYYNQLGKNWIYGFDVFKDSTIKIYIRRSRSDSQIDIIEYLSYYPAEIKIQRREFPVKDTVLNQHWQYWVLFYKSRLPF